MPKISIGLPVYNGENFISDAIQSVLNQTFTDFELIISDNASTDQTSEICGAFAAQDTRIRYYRSEVNRGASWNYNRVVELARGKYFRWLAADDCLAPSLLEKSNFILDRYPQVVLAFTWTQDIDDQGNLIKVKQSNVGSELPSPHERFRGLSYVVRWHNCEEVFGLIRMNILQKSVLIDNYTDSDRTLLAQLGLYGPFYEIPEPLFLHRIHDESSVVFNPDPYERALWFDPELNGKLVLPVWRQWYELMGVIRRSPVKGFERVRLYGEFLRWTKRRRRYLLGSLRYAATEIFCNRSYDG